MANQKLLATVLLASITSSASAEVLRIKAGDWFGCTSVEYVLKLTRYAVDGDKSAVLKGLSGGLASGECTAFKEGETVFFGDRNADLVQVRRKGDTSEYWTFREAIGR